MLVTYKKKDMFPYRWDGEGFLSLDLLEERIAGFMKSAHGKVYFRYQF